MIINKIELGRRINSIRIDRRNTLEEFADEIKRRSEKKIKTTKSNVSRWVKGVNVPNNVTLQIIADIGGITIDELLDENPLVGFTDEELISELERRKQEVLK